jgi:hypothetical protein
MVLVWPFHRGFEENDEKFRAGCPKLKTTNHKCNEPWKPKIGGDKFSYLGTSHDKHRTLDQRFPTFFFPGGTLKIIFHVPRNHYVCKRKQNKDAVGCALELLQYCQLPDKNSFDISRDIWMVWLYFKFSFILQFIMEPLTMFCGTVVGKPCSRKWTRYEYTDF